MSSKQDGKQEKAQQQQPDSFPMTLDEFCAELSQTDRRVEMIGAFHSVEKQARRVKATKAEFTQRFDKFVKQPA